METLLRKYLWAIDLVVIGLCAMFAGRAAATIVESKMAALVPPAKKAARSAPARAATVYTKTVDEILKRNIFCSTCPPILAEPEPEKEAGIPPAPTPVRTSLPIKLMAIMFSPPPNDPRWSMAVIRDTELNSAGPYAIGGKIHSASPSIGTFIPSTAS